MLFVLFVAQSIPLSHRKFLEGIETSPQYVPPETLWGGSSGWSGERTNFTLHADLASKCQKSVSLTCSYIMLLCGNYCRMLFSIEYL